MFALTPRLTLRPGWPEDAPALVSAIAHPAVVRNLSRVPWPYRDADARTFLALPVTPALPRFVVLERDGSRATLVGGIGLSDHDGDGAELGYWLTPCAWGRGLATEAGLAVIAIARTLGHRRLLARHYADNPASGRVLAKLGFRPTGHVTQLVSKGRVGPSPSVELALDMGVAYEDRVAAPIAA